MLIKPILVTPLFIKIYIFFHFLSIQILLSILRELYYILVQEKPKYLYFFTFCPKRQISLKIIYFLN